MKYFGSVFSFFRASVMKFQSRKSILFSPFTAELFAIFFFPATCTSCSTHSAFPSINGTRIMRVPLWSFCTKISYPFFSTLISVHILLALYFLSTSVLFIDYSLCHCLFWSFPSTQLFQSFAAFLNLPQYTRASADRASSLYALFLFLVSICVRSVLTSPAAGTYISIQRRVDLPN